MVKSCLLCLCMALAVVPRAGSAQPPGPAGSVAASDRVAVRAVVESQLAALAAGRAERAFSYASPSIQAQFGNANSFFEMVGRSYPMLIWPASISFFRPEATERSVVQQVQFRDRDGARWKALYELQRQPDKSWRINGCVVAPDDDASTT